MEKEKIRYHGGVMLVSNSRVGVAKEIRLTESIEQELKTAQAILDNNPVLQKSPDDLKEEGMAVDKYLVAFTESEQEKYRDYYEDEL